MSIINYEDQQASRANRPRLIIRQCDVCQKHKSKYALNSTVVNRQTMQVCYECRTAIKRGREQGEYRAYLNEKHPVELVLSETLFVEDPPTLNKYLRGPAYDIRVDWSAYPSQLAEDQEKAILYAPSNVPLKVFKTLTPDEFTIIDRIVLIVPDIPLWKIEISLEAPEDLVVKTALTDAITAANTNKSTAVVSVDGTDVEPGNDWVTTEVMTAYEGAITTAQAVVDNADATQQEVDDAVTALGTATSTFNTAKADGTKPETPDA